MGDIHKKLQKIQHQLKVPKSRWNKFGKFWYRSLEDIYEAVKPLLDEQGLILTVHDEIIMMGNRFYIKATAKLTDIEDEKILYVAHMPGKKKPGREWIPRKSQEQRQATRGNTR